MPQLTMHAFIIIAQKRGVERRRYRNKFQILSKSSQHNSLPISVNNAYFYHHCTKKRSREEKV
jgi:hypothetical protein